MSNQENIISNTETTAEKVNEPVQSKVTKKKPAGFAFVLFLMVLIVGAGAAAAYYFWQLQEKQNSLIKTQQQSLQRLTAELTKVSTAINNNATASAENSTRLVSLKQQILQTEDISQQAIEIVNRNQRDWALAETDYLLRIAHQRIAVARDIAGAIAALNGADARLQQLADITLFKIRKQLAKDIASLNAIHQADVNGISLALDQVIAYLPELPFKSAEEEIKIQFSENDVVQQPKIEEKTFVDSVIETVKQIGDIKVHQRSIQAASNAQQQSRIEQLLRTYLLGARLAALRFDQTQFLHELSQASEILRLHYDVKDNRVQQLQKTILNYSALQLSPDLPELTKAWLLLQSEMKKPLTQTLKSTVTKNKQKNTEVK